MVDRSDDKNYRKTKIDNDQLDKRRFLDEDKKLQHKKNIEFKKHKQEFEENEWEFWKNYYK
jgi:hypothetical protein